MNNNYATLIREDRVHGSLYTDSQVFAEEMDRIFRRGWVFVGHDSEIPEPGEWVTRRVGIEPVIMVRDRGGAIHVLANRCAHRGNTLCWQERGRGNSFQCIYHGWTFGLDGSLRAVSHKAGFDRDRADLPLDRAGQVDLYRGFVFANMSGDAGSLADHLGAGGRDLIDRLCDLSPTGRIRLDAGWIGHRIDSNWKMWPESDSDGYHLDFVHASMLRAQPDNYYHDTVIGGESANISRAVDHGGGHNELDLRPSYARELAWLGVTREKVGAYCEALTARHGKERADRLLWDGPPHGFIFPNLFLGEVNVARVDPLDVGAVVHAHTVMQLEGVDPALNRRLLRQSEAALGPASFIVPDDAIIAERMQVGFHGVRPPVDGANARDGWIDLSRGRARERREADGRRIGHISDEVTNRGFWHHYRHVMESRA
ncbi:MAG: Rieske 2Fe-2S domain-containing protein [Alphaproteobacteria bacterium]|nr:Rieske 2Fe-2S domain-containing protein [Alphaproteobacteria bacterium]